VPVNKPINAAVAGRTGNREVGEIGEAGSLAEMVHHVAQTTWLHRRRDF
jgi:predicted secreted Zn-dependent protease